MANYWVSFRIDMSGHPSRYDAFIETLNDNGTGFWDGPTSFVAISTNLSIDQLGQALKRTISVREDLFVIREIGKDNTRYAGVPGGAFGAFFPNAKAL